MGKAFYDKNKFIYFGIEGVSLNLKRL